LKKFRLETLGWCVNMYREQGRPWMELIFIVQSENYERGMTAKKMDLRPE